MFGCDPEFFFTKNGKITGAEKVLPEHGVHYQRGAFGDINGSVTDGESKVIIDGVQAELNPRPDTCRARLGNEISALFRTLYTTMQEKGVEADFHPSVKITQEEMDTLSEKSKQFGCAPSKNAGGESKMSVTDASKYMYRSAGGHIHLGHRGDDEIKAVLENPDLLIPVLDIIVGNTCVMIDRDPSNIERRKVYGKAGEYRTPPHGIEYRTLSNFWLRSYQLFSLVMGLSRLAVEICADGHAEKLLSMVDIAKVRKAINENDAYEARRNFEAVLPFVLSLTQYQSADHTPLHPDTIDLFEKFIDKDLDYWFEKDALKHWIELPEGHDTGFESFLLSEVKNK